MKKIYYILLIACLCLNFAGCGKTETAQRETRTADNAEEQSTTENQSVSGNKSTDESQGVTDNQSTAASNVNKSKILIVYFTRADNIKVNPDIDATSSASINVNGSSYEGNLAIMADYIKEATDGDTFSILTKEYYPTKYKDTTDTAKEEQSNNARPELFSHIDNMEDYDIIFLGFPNWWGGLPMPVYTFFEEYDFSGKTIIPFASHEGSELGKGPSEIVKLCPGAKVMDGLAVRGSAVGSSKDSIRNWIAGLNLK